MKPFIEKVAAGQDLTVEEASAALETIMTGQATDAQIAGLLMALKTKGESVDELAGFAKVMREKSVAIRVKDPDAVDIVGTGGDGLGTFNISTVSALVVAGAGVTVAKHGNRSISSQSGSADVLSALGVNIQLSPEKVQECINTIGFGFMFAPLFHPAMKYAAKARTELGVRTIFNILGPLTNPAGVVRHFLGAYHLGVAEKMVKTLQSFGVKKACLVHSEDGLDEISVSAPTQVFEINGKEPLRGYQVTFEDFGVGIHPLSAMRGGQKEENAAMTVKILEGVKGPSRDVVVANAAMGIYVAGKAGTLKEGAAMAVESLGGGKALTTLKRLVEFSNRS